MRGYSSASKVMSWTQSGARLFLSDDILLAIEAAPKLKVTFDNGNHAVFEDPVKAFHKLAPYVIHAHFKDWENIRRKNRKFILHARWQIL